MSNRKIRTLRALVAMLCAAAALALGGVLGDPGGPKTGLPAAFLAAPVLRAGVASLLTTGRRPLRAPVVHTAWACVGALVVAALGLLLPGLVRVPPRSLESWLLFLPTVAMFVGLGIVVNMRSLAVGALLLYVVDRHITARVERRSVGEGPQR